MQVGSELNKLQVPVHLVFILLPSAGHKKGAVLVTSAIHIGRLQILPGPLKSIVFFKIKKKSSHVVFTLELKLNKTYFKILGKYLNDYF